MNTERHVGTTDAATLWLAYNLAENERDVEAMAKLVAPDLAAAVNGQPAASSAEDDQKAMAHLFDVYPDYRREVEEVIAAGDRAVARWRMRGQPRDPTLPVLDLPGCSVVTTLGSVITAAHLYYQGEVLDQILEAAKERR